MSALKVLRSVQSLCLGREKLLRRFCGPRFSSWFCEDQDQHDKVCLELNSCALFIQGVKKNVYTL